MCRIGSGAAQAARCLEYPIQYHPNVEPISNDDVVRIEFQMDWVGLRSRAVNTEENRWLAPMRLTGRRVTGRRLTEDENRWLAPMRLTGKAANWKVLGLSPIRCFLARPAVGVWVGRFLGVGRSLDSDRSS